MHTQRNPGTVLVLFLEDHRPFRRGERASVTPREASTLIQIGVATIVVEEPKTDSRQWRPRLTTR